MKSLIQAVVLAAAIAAPVAAFAQANQPVTRAQVRAELVQLEKAGYQPGHADPHYPADIQAAQARVDAQNGTGQAATTGFGGTESGTTQTSHAAPTVGPKSMADSTGRCNDLVKSLSRRIEV
jgi:opacity protein-like surface antigen